MKKKNPNRLFRVPPAIPGVRGNSKFKFEAVITGEWDWNKSVAGEEPDSLLKEEARIGPFSRSLQPALATLIFNANIGISEMRISGVRLTHVELTPEMCQVWRQYQIDLQTVVCDVENLEKELGEVEAHRLKLKKAIATAKKMIKNKE